MILSASSPEKAGSLTLGLRNARSRITYIKSVMGLSVLSKEGMFSNKQAFGSSIPVAPST